MSIPFACDMTAIPPEQRDTHHDLVRRLMTESVEEISELTHGLAFRFSAEEYDAVTEFVGAGAAMLSHPHLYVGRLPRPRPAPPSAHRR